MPSVTSHTQQDQSAGPLVDSRWRRDYMRVVLGLLTVAPTLQSKTPEPIRDTELSEIFATCDDDLFLNQADLYFRTIRHQMLGLGSPQLGQLLLRFETLLTQYAHARSERLQVLVVRFLDATMPLWLQPTVALAEAGSQTRDLCHWLASMLNWQKIRSWVIRDLICTFFDRYLACDPYHQFWAPATSSQDREDEVPQDLYPCIILPKLGGDEDIRVRFRVASVNSRILVTAKVMGQEPIQWYDGVRQWLSEELERYDT
jgi:ataxia telangiectasia mutated family protein